MTDVSYIYETRLDRAFVEVKHESNIDINPKEIRVSAQASRSSFLKIVRKTSVFEYLST